MDNLARQFIAKLRAHGHRPYVEDGHFGFEPFVREPTLQSEPHHAGEGRSYPFGFDDRPFAALLKDPERRGELIAAVREAEDFANHVSGLDR